MVEITCLWEDWADQSHGLPEYETAGAAGVDLRANFANRDPVVLAPGARALISSGLRVEIPQGYEMQIRPRSGLAYKHGVTVLNSPGTIDSDYRGPVGILLVNLSETAFEVTHGMRIAQAVIAPVVQSHFVLADQLNSTARGADGFGSTGAD